MRLINKVFTLSIWIKYYKFAPNLRTFESNHWIVIPVSILNSNTILHKVVQKANHLCISVGLRTARNQTRDSKFRDSYANEKTFPWHTPRTGDFGNSRDIREKKTRFRYFKLLIFLTRTNGGNIRRFFSREM